MQLLDLIKVAIGQIQATAANHLEVAVRKLFILYHLHISNQDVLEGEKPEEDAKLSLSAPVQFHGRGKISIPDHVVFGVIGSPGNLSYSYIAAITEDSRISFGTHSAINNRVSIVANGSSITIGRNCLMGPDCLIGDSNGHELAIDRRREPDSRPRPVSIGDDVFIGARVCILKGVTIGNGCVIAAGAVLMPGFTCAPNMIIAGNPAQVVRPVKQ
ncbi:MAG: acyltransferase [Rhodospirillales bacterium]|nr:acyltransferase [Alphaproteobacteria bacterium]MCB9986941.1 acyltransferase [Rhodospirillales bacterium]USO08284.1 MAG: acyltransferase [Rhodospirillales bacterium]